MFLSGFDHMRKLGFNRLSRYKASATDCELLVAGTAISMGQMGPDFLLLRSSIDHPPAEVIILMCIDGNEDRWSVRLPNGLSVNSERVRIAVAASRA
jgi:hypothetical protein